ncbi:hypothetical protein BH18ACT15_BH18ACT15_12840 [soil metagenome]
MRGNKTLTEGWYLMSVGDLELELARLRSPRAELPPSNAKRLSVKDALARRAAGNLPDELGRTLRLVLEAASAEELSNLHVKRLSYEPDFHDAPRWRREGSKPVNVVPLRRSGIEARSLGTWLEDPELQLLEEEWRRTGCIAGMRVPGEYRGVRPQDGPGSPLGGARSHAGDGRRIGGQVAGLRRRRRPAASPR